MDDGRPFILLDAAQAVWRWTRGYVENVAAAFVAVVEDERAAGVVYNVGEDAACTEETWIQHIGTAVGWAGRVIPLPVPPEADNDWQHHMMADTRKIRTELGYLEPVARAEAIQRTVAWERAHPPDPIDPGLFDYAAEAARLAAAGDGC